MPALPPLGVPMPMGVSVPPNPPAQGARMQPISPYRLLDTRSNGGAPLGAGRYLTLQVTGRAGIPQGASGALLNVVMVAPAAAGYSIVWPSGNPLPLASSQNFAGGQVVAGLVWAALGPDGAVNIGSTSQSHIVVDVACFMSPSTGGYAVSTTPFRLFDSRVAPNTIIRAGQGRTIQVGGVGAVPSSASAVQVNIAVTQPNRGGWLALFPGPCSSFPGVSSINYGDGETIANFAVVPLDASGAICVLSGAADVHVILDVAGYVQAAPGSVFFPVTPQRLIDTRTGSEPLPSIRGRLVAGQPLVIPVVGLVGTPTTAKAIAASFVAVNPERAGFITAYPCDKPVPPSSSVNFAPGGARPNAISVPLSGSGTVCVQSSCALDIVVDLAGYFL